jgi:hypothetical protein
MKEFLRIIIQCTKNGVIYLEEDDDDRKYGGIIEGKPPPKVLFISHMSWKLV